MNKRGFTIVELLVVIVIIGILAAITIVAYNGVNQKAIAASLQSDLSNGSNRLKMYYVEYGVYPASLDVSTNCPNGSTPADSRYCLNLSPNTTFTYASSNPYSTYSLTAQKSGISYTATNDSTPTQNIIIGTQTWMKYNLNVGTMIANTVVQTNNGVVEKYCYNNLESNCVAYGGIYQWNEAMKFGASESRPGICPNGFHIPTDSEFKTLEMYLGMSQAQADATTWRGTDQGTQLMTGAFKAPLGGHMEPFPAHAGVFWNIGTETGFWTSTQGTNPDPPSFAWYRQLYQSNSTSYRNSDFKTDWGFQIRCLMD